MYLDLTSIKNDKNVILEFSEKVSLKKLGEEFANYHAPEPFLINGTVKNTENGYFLKGIISGNIASQCSLCLKDIDYPIRFTVERIYKTAFDEESFPLIDFKINLDELVYEEVVLNLPIKPVCQEMCLGLCPVCGQNLNERDCECYKDDIDVRLLPLMKLLEKQKGV